MKPHYFSQSPLWLNAFAKHPAKSKTGLLFGVELEMEATNYWPDPDALAKNVQNMSAHHDDSLRHRGVEFITVNPAPRETIIQDVSNLYSLIKTFKTNVLINSPRTSTHVHINFQDKALHEILNFIFCLYVVEELLFTLTDPKRSSNLFCLSIHDAEYQLHNLEGIIQGDLGNFTNISNSKYSNINLSSISTHGTIEIRALHGNPTITELNHWLTILEEIYNFSQQKNFDVRTHILQDISALSPLPWLEKISPTLYLLTANIPQRNALLLDNLRFIQPLLYTFIRKLDYAKAQWTSQEDKKKGQRADPFWLEEEIQPIPNHMLEDAHQEIRIRPNVNVFQINPNNDIAFHAGVWDRAVEQFHHRQNNE